MADSGQISRRRLFATVMAVAVLYRAHAQDAGRQLRLAADDLRAMRSFEDTISDFESVSYVVALRRGQSLNVVLASTNAASCFDIHAPGLEKPVYIGGESGNRHQLVAQADGEYAVRVFLLRFAARDGQSARYTLELKVAGPVL